MLAIEIGFGDVKVVGEEIKFKFPSVLAYGDNGVLRGWNDENKFHYFRGKSYIVGKEALGYSEMFSSRAPEFLIEFAPLFLYKAFEYAGIKSDTIALGLAVGYYSAKDKLMRKVRSFEINGQLVEIPNCYVFPQAVGIWFDWSSNNRERTHRNYMILDVGFNTVDVIFIKNGQVSKEGSWMLEGEGIIKVVNHLADQIQQKVGVGLTSHIAKSLLENKSITIYGKERSLEKIIAKLSSSYSERLFSVLEQRCREELRNADGIIIGGGGAYYVRGSIPKRLRNLIEIVEEPEFANARGFYKFLRAKGGKNENTDQQRVGENYKEPEATV